MREEAARGAKNLSPHGQVRYDQGANGMRRGHVLLGRAVLDGAVAEREPRVVFHLVRAFFDPSAGPGVLQAEAVDWGRALQIAQAHGVGALCHEALARWSKAAPALARPERVFLIERRLAAYRSARTGRDLARILRALGDRGIRPVLLKGVSLAYFAYPSPLFRTMADIDLLVREHDVGPALAALISLGYQAPGTAATRWEAENLYPHLPPFTAPGRVPVEVHFRLFSRAAEHFPGEDDVWKRVMPAHVEGGQALRMAPADELLYLCGHLRKHAATLTRMIWFCDIALAWRRMEGSHRDALAYRLRDTSYGREMEGIVRTARAWFLGDAVPAAHDIRATLNSPLTMGERDRSEAWSRLRDQMRGMPHWPARARFVAGYLFPALAYIRQYHGPSTVAGAWWWRLHRPLWALSRGAGALWARWKARGSDARR
jgi:hypothetical protein